MFKCTTAPKHATGAFGALGHKSLILHQIGCVPLGTPQVVQRNGAGVGVEFVIYYAFRFEVFEWPDTI